MHQFLVDLFDEPTSSAAAPVGRRMACRSMGANANNSQALAACSEFNHKVACDKQAICHWTITEYHGELCENGGVHVGCGGLASQLDSRCAIHRTLSSCQAGRIQTVGGWEAEQP